MALAPPYSLRGVAIGMAFLLVRLSTMVFRLYSQPKPYEWGVPGGISYLLGLPPAFGREAEIWWGDHPDSNCLVETESGKLDFSTFLERESLVFPRLVKILAVQQSLSIQVHPDSKQAIDGYYLEDSRGISIQTPERIFKDKHGKPELLIALSEEFYALSGFLGPQRLKERMEEWLSAGAPAQLKLTLQEYAFSAEGFVRALLQREDGLAALANELRIWLKSKEKSELAGLVNDGLRSVKKIFDDNPHDDSALFAVVMNHVTLKQGEALFVRPSTVHAYLSGFGLEIMFPSDNVVRAGLTSKKVSVREFIDIADLDASTPELVGSQDWPWGLTYRPPELGVVVRKLTVPGVELEIDSPSVCIVERGSIETEDRGRREQFPQGSTLFATSGTKVSSRSGMVQIWVISCC